MDLSAIKPVKGSAEVFVITKGDTPKPENVFLKNGFLAESYNTETPMMVQGIAGSVERKKVAITRGPNTGKELMREFYDGDVKTVVTLLRDAARELEIGVSIRVIPETFATGAKKGEPNGKCTVHYLGKEAKRKRTAITSNGVPEDLDDETDENDDESNGTSE